MFTTLARHLTRTRRHHTTSRRERTNRPGVEALEHRLAPSASPFVYSVLDDRGKAPGHTTATAQTVSLAPMMQSEVLASRYWGLAPRDATHDLYKVQLRKGQIFTAGDHAVTAWGMIGRNQLSLLDGSGKVLTSSTGSAVNSGFAYRVQQDGTYYVALDLVTVHIPPVFCPAMTMYELDLRPIGLNPAMQDPSWLQKAGGEMDVWLDGTTLDISGPAGHGFGVRGNWTQTVQQAGSLSSSTYRATGIITLQTAGGAVNIGLPRGSALTVTTQPGQWGAYFGAVGSLVGAGTFSLSDLAAPFGKNSPLNLGLVAGVPQQQWGIDLGSGLGASGLPLNAAVPYLHFLSSNDASASFGGIHVQLDHAGQGFNIVADPADPAIYVNIKGLPYISNFGVGWSTHALIPFAPVTKPAGYSGALAGNFYHVGEVDLTDAGIPIIIDGDWTVNFDPRHTGKSFGGASINASDLLAVLDGKRLPSAALLKQMDTIFKNVSFEHNGTLNLGYQEDGAGSIQVPVVQDSDLFDGPAQTLYLRGTTVNPLQGTVLQDFVKGVVSVDGTFNRASGQADVILAGDFAVLGQVAKGSVELTNHKVSFQGDISTLGTSVHLTGDIAADGSATLMGDATTNFYIGSAAGHFSLTHAAAKAGLWTSLSVAADLMVLGQDLHLAGSVQPNGNYWISGGITSGFFLAGGSASFVFSHGYGSDGLSINGRLNTPVFGVTITGSANSQGDYDLYGSTGASFLIASGQARFHLAHSHVWGTSLTMDGYYSALDANVHVTGDVQPSGDYTLSGQADVNFFVGWGSATFTVASQGGSRSLALDGHVSTLGADVHVTGQAWSDGTYVFKGHADANFFLAGGSADMVLANYGSGPTCTVDAYLHLLGGNVDLHGQAYENGDFSFTQSGSFAIPLLANVSESFTLSRTGGNIGLGGELKAVTAVPLSPLQGSLDVTFSVTADGNGRPSYFGSGTAEALIFGNPIGEVDVTLAANTITFSANWGFLHPSVTITLPN
jgi:hypothetical protein